MINNKVDIESIDLELNAPINYAIKYGKSPLVKLLMDKMDDKKLDNIEIFYQIITYQDDELISYFIDKNLIDINQTNWIWTLILFGNKSMYSQIIQYSIKKLYITTFELIDNLHKYCDKHRINDIIDDDEMDIFYRF